MRYVYEIMSYAQSLADVTLDGIAKDLSPKASNMFTGAIDAMEKRMNMEIDVISHSQTVVGDHLLTSVMVRRSASAADPRRN